MILKRIATDRFGSIMISVILGLGLAALFRRACSGDGCFVIKSPSAKEVNDYVYKVDKACYKYTPNVVPCKLKSAAGGGTGGPAPSSEGPGDAAGTATVQ